MTAMASRISMYCSTMCLGAGQRKRSASLAFVRGIHRWPMHPPPPPQRPVTRKVFPFNDVIMNKEKWSLAGIETGPLNGFEEVEIALYFYRAHLSQRIRKKSNKCELLGYVNNKQRILSKKAVCSLKMKTSYSVETAYHPPLYEHSPHNRRS